VVWYENALNGTGYSYNATVDWKLEKVALSATDEIVLRWDSTTGLLSQIAYPNGTTEEFVHNATGELAGAIEGFDDGENLHIV
jgi:hypothetical protein